MPWTLFDILDYESSDNPEERRERAIRLVFLGNRVGVESRDVATGQNLSIYLPHDELKDQIEEAKSARYFDSFCKLVKAASAEEAIPVKKILALASGELEKDEALFYRAQEAISLSRLDSLTSLLSDKKMNINFIDGAGVSPTLLYLAADGGNADICKFLLDCGADPNIGRNHQGYKALHRAAFQGNVDIAKLLLDHGARIDEPNVHGGTPLEIAVMMSRKEVVSLLLDRGADPYKASEDIFSIASEFARNIPPKWNGELKKNIDAVVELLDDWKTKQAQSAHARNLAKLDRILGRNKK